MGPKFAFLVRKLRLIFVNPGCFFPLGDGNGRCCRKGGRIKRHGVAIGPHRPLTHLRTLTHRSI